MKIYGLQKLSLLDFKGKAACTVFTGGCNFRCPFCHNASLVTKLDEVETIDEDEFFFFLNKRKNLLDGVCITGGEPLLQPDILPFVQKIKDIGYPVKLDTNGSFPDKLIEIVESGLIDYVAMDIKSSQDEYPKICGISSVNMADINKSVQFLLSDTVDYEFRTTIMREFHTEKELEAIAQWINGAKNYFLQSFIDSGDILSGSYTSYKKAELEHFAQLVAPYVSYVEIRGV